MNPNEKPQKTFFHKDQEQNLLAVKHSLKQHGRADMTRQNVFADEVMDVVADGKIIERHISNKTHQVIAIVVHRTVQVEEVALYQ